MTPAVSPIRHRTITIEGIETFYREAGAEEAPVILLPHGYPGSSYAYRNLLVQLGNRWRLIAPDMPGFGYSATPASTKFAHTFDAYAGFLRAFVDAMRLSRYPNMSFQGRAREHRVPPIGPMEREPDWGLTSVWRRRQGGSRSVADVGRWGRQPLPLLISRGW